LIGDVVCGFEFSFDGCAFCLGRFLGEVKDFGVSFAQRLGENTFDFEGSR